MGIYPVSVCYSTEYFVVLGPEMTGADVLTPCSETVPALSQNCCSQSFVFVPAVHSSTPDAMFGCAQIIFCDRLFFNALLLATRTEIPRTYAKRAVCVPHCQPQPQAKHFISDQTTDETC